MRRLVIPLILSLGCGTAVAQQSINRGLTGNWYNPETSGQGLMLEVFPDTGKLFAIWFTYEEQGGTQQWLTGTGDYDGNTVSFDLLRREGAQFDRASEPQVATWGNATLAFESCTRATFSFEKAGSGTTVDIPMERIAPDYSCGGEPVAIDPELPRTHVVNITTDRFNPEVLTIQAGDSVRWQNLQGTHSIEVRDGIGYEDLNSGTLEPGAVFDYEFTTAQPEVLYSSPAQNAMTGAVVVEPSFDLGFGASGAWFNPNKSGQGMLVEYVPTTDVVVVGWFTFSPSDGSPLWLTAAATADRNEVSITLRRPEGGVLNDPTPTTQPDWGSLHIRFHGCNSATATYESRPDLVSGQIRLERIAPSADCVE